MEEYTCMIPRDSYDGAFYRAVLALHNDHYTQAQQVTGNIRKVVFDYKYLQYMLIEISNHEVHSQPKTN